MGVSLDDPDDVELIRPEALLWQTGYLTIADVLCEGGLTAYTLRLPNQEVRTALNRSLLSAWIPHSAQAMRAAFALRHTFGSGELEPIRGHCARLFAAIPHDWYRNNPIAQYEGYFASVFYSHLAALGLEIIAEDVTNEGQCDLTVKQGDLVWIFEFKIIEGDEPTGEALAQLKAKDYAAKYRAAGVQVIEVGIEFSRSQRQIVGWAVADGGAI